MSWKGYAWFVIVVLGFIAGIQQRTVQTQKEIIEVQGLVVETQKTALLGTCLHLGEGAPLKLQKACLGFLKEYAP